MQTKTKLTRSGFNRRFRSPDLTGFDQLRAGDWLHVEPLLMDEIRFLVPFCNADHSVDTTGSHTTGDCLTFYSGYITCGKISLRPRHRAHPARVLFQVQLKHFHSAFWARPEEGSSQQLALADCHFVLLNLCAHCAFSRRHAPKLCRNSCNKWLAQLNHTQPL